MLALHLGNSDFKYRDNKFGKVVYHDRKKGLEKKKQTLLTYAVSLRSMHWGKKRLYIINNAILIEL